MRTPCILLHSAICICLISVCTAGCLFLRDDHSIRCQNTSLLDIAESLHILTAVVLNRPHTIEVEDCKGSDRLPTIFESIAQNSGVQTVRIRRSDLRSLQDQVFIPIANDLKDLDLSHNQLTSLPKAMVVLKVLEHLNLQHNMIVFLKPDGVLDSLPMLKELNLAHNYIGLAEELEENNNEQHGYRLKGTLQLQDFSLGRASRSLESVSLRGNRMATIPTQISGHGLPELRHLDLSENVIGGRINEFSSSLLPKLEYLHLQYNRIQSLQFYSMPSTLKYLDLTDNPFHCNCSSMWLYEWFQTNTTDIRLPICNSPEKFKDLAMEEMPWAVECPEINSTLRYMTKDSEEYDVIKLASSSNYITVSWKVDDQSSNIGKWTIVYRKSDDSPYQMTVVPITEPQQTSRVVLTQRITGLNPKTNYIVCVALVLEAKYTIEPNKCRKITTKGTSTNTDLIKGIRTEIEELSVSATAINIRWRLKMPSVSSEEDEDNMAESIRHEWTIRIRRTGSDNYTNIPVYDITSGHDIEDQVYEYGISDLSPRTHYDVCLVDVEHRAISDEDYTPLVTNETSSCSTVQTYNNYILYATEIVAITLACAICFIVSAVTIILCKQKKLLRWQSPTKLRKWLSRRCKERPQPIGCNSHYATTSTLPRVQPSSAATDARCLVGTWNTLRSPYSHFGDIDRPEFRSFRTTTYRDALTSVTIYKSGYSEC
ncbi:leucine-rich repeat transmembrane protein FLRT3 [Parasteatoda tepidariorum]|uniref:leucine-rich repeat transmembrane protein FLRT3 n=1 Tax=Parasteatoda tepidariorum TaxID=114398 RepID=UPI00077FC6E4|nr:leucine-rich repeat transmembrane protein FLRT3 [Parasteatoda tepidariorum]